MPADACNCHRGTGPLSASSNLSLYDMSAFIILGESFSSSNIVLMDVIGEGFEFVCYLGSLVGGVFSSPSKTSSYYFICC